MAFERTGRVVIPDSGTTSEQWPIDGANSLIDEQPADEFGSVDLGGNTGASGDGDDTIFDPERHLGLDRVNADGTYRRKRKRKGSAGNSSSPRKSSSRTEISASVDTLSNVLMVFHMGLATMLKTPEIATTEAENRTLGTAVVNVLEAYDLKPDPKIATVVGLIMACGQVYGPKTYFIRERLKEEAVAKRQSAQSYM